MSVLSTVPLEYTLTGFDRVHDITVGDTQTHSNYQQKKGQVYTSERKTAIRIQYIKRKIEALYILAKSHL